ncbi:hypothetical protein WMY93_033360 [Mugilogobius chulae]|uniref:NPHP4 Ig-like domain-containing protein n=1 Tax=Mugilogobius chulae TaxID=88201 RepID=A0AAW0MLE3_9GOBI
MVVIRAIDKTTAVSNRSSTVHDNHYVHRCTTFRPDLHFQLELNPFPSSFCVCSVITSSAEWRYFKSLSHSPTAVEENMFHVQPGAPGPQVYLRPKESLHIPLKYQSFECHHSSSAHGPSVLPAGPGPQVAQRNQNHVASSRTIKAPRAGAGPRTSARVLTSSAPCASQNVVIQTLQQKSDICNAKTEATKEQCEETRGQRLQL